MVYANLLITSGKPKQVVNIILLLDIALFGAVSATDQNNNIPDLPEICAIMPGIIISRPHSCNRWIKCPARIDASDYLEGTCVMGHYFHEAKQKCAPEKEVLCPYASEQVEISANQAEPANAPFVELSNTNELSVALSGVSKLCALANGSIILYPNSCTRWIRCPATFGANDYEEGSCVSGLYFDEHAQTCAPKDSVKCRFTHVQDQNRADPLDITAPNSSGGSDLVTAQPTNWRPTGSLYTNALPVTVSTVAHVDCPYNRNVYRVNPADCRQYYICMMGIPILTACPQELRWNEKAELCDLPKNVKCYQNKNTK